MGKRCGSVKKIILKNKRERRSNNKPLQTVQLAFNFVETFINLLETLIDLLKTLIDLLEASVNLIKICFAFTPQVIHAFLRG